VKKTLTIFLAVIAGIYLVLSLFDRGEYAVEKRMWRLKKQFSLLAQDPKAVPEKQFENVAEKYRKLARKYPKSAYAPAMLLQAGNVYMLNQDYVKAREAFQVVVEKFSDNDDAGAAALLGIGASYAGEKNLSQAVKTYRKIMAAYPLTDIGLNMPIYIANYYRQNGQNEEAQAAFVSAETYYQNIAAANTANPRVRFDSQRLLAATYMAQKKWGAAVGIFESILLEYARSPYLNWRRAQLLIASINQLSIGQLNDVARAAAVYQKFIADNPGHPLNAVLQKMLAAFSQIKSANSSSNQSNK